MRYSVVIPTYTTNEEHVDVLEDCLRSVLRTKTEDTEVILVDDGSTIHEPLERNKILCDVVIHHNKNKGIAASWNDGIKIARGEYIAVINDDITVQEGWLDKLRMTLEDDEANMVAAPGVVGKENGTGIEENYQWFPGYCYMLKRETIEKIGLFDEQFSPFNYEDTDYWTRVLKAGGKLVRNYNTTITHKEGHVLHALDYEGVSEVNKQKFLAKHGFDPIPVFYYNEPFPYDTQRT